MRERHSVVHIVRHGATEWSQAGRHTGRTDMPLNALGETQAKNLGPTLAETKFDRVLSSPLVRARRTAELSGFPHCETSPLLLEADYGADEGRTRDEIRADRPGWEFFEHGPNGGESLADIAARATKLIAELEGTVLLFSHGHFTRIFTMTWLGRAPGEGRHLTIDPASLAILDQEHAFPVIRLWNFSPPYFSPP